MTPAATNAFLRGVAFAAGQGVPYPRQDPADFTRLPVDTWQSAQLPVGVRVEWVGEGPVTLHYRTLTDDLGYRGAGAGQTFTHVVDAVVVDEQPAMLGEGRVVFHGRRGRRSTVYLPEGMKPEVLSVDAADGVREAPPQPRWLCYGDSIAEGWIASGPSWAWPAIVGRTIGLDTVNLGFAGSARGETVSAEHLAKLNADAITLSHGTNCWTRIPHSVRQMQANLEAFLDIVRSAHVATPILFVSPVTRPDAESKPNRLGATLRDLRIAMEQVVSARISFGDDCLHLLPGRDLLPASLLGDGVHPNDEGHRTLAAAIGPVLQKLMPQPKEPT